MQMRELTGTGIATSALGFGTASLFHLPQARARRAVLEAAFDAGIRHVDVAPMYGLGRAEAELAPFLEGRRDAITVATKFGIDTTVAGRAAGRVQGPVRSLLGARPGVGRQLKRSGGGPASGVVGSLLYRSPGYTAAAAAASLERSLRALRTEYVDIFELHDPQGGLDRGLPELVDFLEEQRERGRIRAWGIAGDVGTADPVITSLATTAPVVQYRRDIFDEPRGPGGRATITFGILERALPAIREFLQAESGRCATWSRRLGTDVNDDSVLAQLLVREAIDRATSGPVLFTSTRVDRVLAAATTADAPSASDPERAAALVDLADAVRGNRPGLRGER